MNDPFELLSQIGLLPVLDCATPDTASCLAAAFIDAGLTAIDLPIRTDHFLDVSGALLKTGVQLICASGVRTQADCQLAVSGGASLLVGYGLYPDIADWSRRNRIAYIPCCTSGCEVERAVALGLTTVLYAPCEDVVPCEMLYEMWKDAGLRFLVSGGIGKDNYLQFADKPYITAVRGSFLCPQDLAAQRDYAALGRFAGECYLNLIGFELGHIGISTQDGDEGHQLTDELSSVFGAPAIHGGIGNWALHRGIEVVNGKGPGLHGHFAVQCNSVDRAIYYLEQRHHKIKHDSFRYRYPGRLSFAYLEEEFGGFAVHLMLRWTAY